MPDALRSLAATVLAVPVLASIYAGVLVRSRRGRAGLVVVVVAVGIAGSVAAWLPPTEARPPRTIETLAVDRFSDVALGSAGGLGSDAGVNGLSTTPAESSTEPTTTSAPPTSAPLAAESSAEPTPAQALDPPTVVRFRPRGGTEGVDPSAALSVRFDTPMDPAAASSFTASIDDRPLDGTAEWAEDGTVLVFTPATSLPYGARVTLRVEAGAGSVAGAELAVERAISFTVEPRPAPTATPGSAPEPAPTAGSPTPTPRPAGTGSESTADAAWRWPLEGPITQRFGESLTKYGYHYGIDIDGSTGDPVRAAGSGTVVVAGHYDGCGGNEVHIDHGDGLVSWYRHLSRIDVSVGDRVSAGALIGLVGDTGCSLGSHLHFAIRRGSTFLDPLDFLPSR